MSPPPDRPPNRVDLDQEEVEGAPLSSNEGDPATTLSWSSLRRSLLPRRSGRREGKRWVAEALVVAALFLAAVWRWRADVSWSEPHWDEIAYVEAIRSLLAGGSPYEAEKFVYAPPFAVLGAQVALFWGETSLLVTLRLLSLAGGAFILWSASALAGWRWRARFAASLVGLWFAPIVASNMLYGNVSLFIVGVAMAGLWAATRHPLLAGALVGTSIGLKPMVVPAIATLGGPLLGRRWNRRVVAAVVTVATAGALQLVGWRYLPGFFGNARGLPETSANISLSRVLYCFGVEVPPLVIVGVVAAAAGLWSWRSNFDRGQTVVVASTLSLLAIPSTTLHTMSLSFPVQFAALGLALRRFRAAPRPRAIELAAVGTGVISAHSVHALGGIGESLVTKGLVAAIPVLAPLVLTIYWLRLAAGSGGEQGMTEADK